MTFYAALSASATVNAMWSPPHTPVRAGEGPAGLPLQPQLAKTVLRTNTDRARPNGRNMLDSVLSPFLITVGPKRRRTGHSQYVGTIALNERDLIPSIRWAVEAFESRNALSSDASTS
jgi:hypothetical protein